MNKADNFIINRICKSLLESMNNYDYEIENDRAFNNYREVSGALYGYVFYYPYFTANDFKIEEDRGWVYINVISDNLQVEKFRVGVAFEENRQEKKLMVEDSPYKIDKIEPEKGKVFKLMKFNTCSRKVVIMPDSNDARTLNYRHTNNPVPIDNLRMVLSVVAPERITSNWDNPLYKLFVYNLEYWVNIKFSKR